MKTKHICPYVSLKTASRVRSKTFLAFCRYVLVCSVSRDALHGRRLVPARLLPCEVLISQVCTKKQQREVKITSIKSTQSINRPVVCLPHILFRCFKPPTTLYEMQKPNLSCKHIKTNYSFFKNTANYGIHTCLAVFFVIKLPWNIGISPMFILNYGYFILIIISK